MTFPNLVGLASFAATVATLVFVICAEVRARLATPTYGDFTRL